MTYLNNSFRFTLVIILLITWSIQAQDASDILEKQIDSIFSNYDDLNKPGASVAVVNDGKIVFKKGYGSANLEYGIRNTPSTVFHIASVSKQFTVFSILLLEKKGKLNFDDDIRKYIPEVPDFGKTITLRHLASHTSGMRDQWNLLNMAGWRMDDVITKEHILKLVSKQKELNFNPGEEYLYCNTGFTLLAEVVARISGKTFAEFTKTNIFNPLKMSKTLFYDDHEKIVKDRAYSYYQNGDGYKKSVLNFANVGATSLFTTVEDLSLWSMNFITPKVGDKNIINKMNALAVLNNGNNFGGAYGQFVNTYKGLNQIQHGGADAGYRSYLGRFPDQKFAVVVFSNSASSNPGGLSLQVADLYLKDFLEKPIKKKEKAEIKGFITLGTEQLEKFSGNYWNEAGVYARRIYVKNDTLRYFRNERSESLLAPLSKNEFQMLNVAVDLKVKFKGKGSSRTMIVTIDGGDPISSDEFTPPNYNSNTLKEFNGIFYSEELSTYYTIKNDEEKLILMHSRMPDFDIMPIKNDMFSNNGIVKFERNKSGEITGFRTSNGRVRNLLFRKIK